MFDSEINEMLEELGDKLTAEYEKRNRKKSFVEQLLDAIPDVKEKRKSLFSNTSNYYQDDQDSGYFN